MQPKNSTTAIESRAEVDFRSAFERLKNGSPQKIPPGSPISQNNIAREAGCDPSALKKSRYPQLVEEIQIWIGANTHSKKPSPTQRILKKREHNRSLKQHLDEVKGQRDHLASLLLEANAKILDLSEEIHSLRLNAGKSNVTRIKEVEKGGF